MNDPTNTEGRPMAAAGTRRPGAAPGPEAGVRPLRPAAARSAATVARRLIEAARRRPEVWETLRAAFLSQPPASSAAPSATAAPEPSESRTHQDGRESRQGAAVPAAAARPAEPRARPPEGDGGSDRRVAGRAPEAAAHEPFPAGVAGLLPAWRGAGLPPAERAEDGGRSGDEPSPPRGRGERSGQPAGSAAESPRDPAPDRAGDAAHLAAAPAVSEWLSSVARLSEGHLASFKAAAALLRAQNEAVAELHAEVERLHASLQTLGRQTDRHAAAAAARLDHANNHD